MNLTEYINKGLSYEDYITRVEDDLENEIENDDPKEYVQYYALGLQRMNRIFKTFSLNPAQETRVKSTSNNLKLLRIEVNGIPVDIVEDQYYSVNCTKDRNYFDNKHNEED